MESSNLTNNTIFLSCSSSSLISTYLTSATSSASSSKSLALSSFSIFSASTSSSSFLCSPSSSMSPSVSFSPHSSSPCASFSSSMSPSIINNSEITPSSYLSFRISSPFLNVGSSFSAFPSPSSYRTLSCHSLPPLSSPILHSACISSSTTSPFFFEEEKGCNADSFPLLNIPEWENQEIRACSKSRNLLCKFKNHPKRILIIKRLHSVHVTNLAAQLIRYVTETFGIKVIVEPAAVADMLEVGVKNIFTWKKGSNMYDVIRLIDFIVTIGGDGTILWTSHLFPHFMPPVVGVCMGSLGYLNQFNASDIQNAFNLLHQSYYYVTLRCRLSVRVVNENNEIVKELCAMNECILDRGPSPFLTMLDVYCNEQFFTTVSADGLILATPTGSTAYSMSAGGAMVHPKVPCILFTPICPHSLSFRPVILPDTVTLRIVVPSDSRYHAWVAVDGRSRTEIKKGMSVLISMSHYPFPMVVKEENCDGWLRSLTKGLNWNQRIRQAPIYINSTANTSNTVNTNNKINASPTNGNDNTSISCDSIINSSNTDNNASYQSNTTPICSSFNKMDINSCRIPMQFSCASRQSSMCDSSSSVPLKEEKIGGMEGIKRNFGETSNIFSSPAATSSKCTEEECGQREVNTCGGCGGETCSNANSFLSAVYTPPEKMGGRCRSGKEGENENACNLHCLPDAAEGTLQNFFYRKIWSNDNESINIDAENFIKEKKKQEEFLFPLDEYEKKIFIKVDENLNTAD